MNASKKLDILQALTLACETMDISKIEKVWSVYSHELGDARGIFVVDAPECDKPFLPPDDCIQDKCFIVRFLKGRQLRLLPTNGSPPGFECDYQLFAHTNFVSYCNTAFLGGPLGSLADAFYTAGEYLLPRRAKLNALSYIVENFERRHVAEVRDSVKAFAAFKLADAERFRRDRTIRPNISGPDLEAMTARIIAPLESPHFKVVYEGMKQNYLLSLVALTKTAAIALGADARKSSKHKLLSLLDYFDREVTLVPKLELFSAWRLYETKSQEPFFRKVQQRAKNLIASLGSMAWDLAHWRNAMMMETVTSGLGLGARFLVPYFLTFDRAYAELLKRIQLRGILFHGRDYTPIYDARTDQMLMDVLRDAENVLSPSAIESRRNRRPPDDKFTSHLERLTQALNQELLATIGGRETDNTSST